MALGFFRPGERTPGSVTPDDLKRRRAFNDRLMATASSTAPVQGGWVEALSRVLTGGIAGYSERRASDTEAAEKAQYRSTLDKELDRYFSGQGSAGGSSSAASYDGTSSGTGQGPSASSAERTQTADLSGNKAEFVNALMPAALEASARTGVDPRIIVAQAAHESGWGKSAPGNNYFGIKSHGKGGGQTFTTHEVVNGKRVKIQDSFRSFASPGDSVAGYADFITENPRYRAMREAQGLDAQVDALGRSGYATDPTYGAKIGSIARSLPMPSGANEPTQVASLDSSAGMTAYAPQPKPANAKQAIADLLSPATNVPPSVSVPPPSANGAPNARALVADALTGGGTQGVEGAPPAPPAPSPSETVRDIGNMLSPQPEPSRRNNLSQLMQLYGNEWASPEQKAMVGMLIQQEMEQNAPLSPSERLAQERFRYEQSRDTIEDRRAENARQNALGSGLIDQSQKMTAAAMQIAEKKVWAHRS